MLTAKRRHKMPELRLCIALINRSAGPNFDLADGSYERMGSQDLRAVQVTEVQTHPLLRMRSAPFRLAGDRKS